MGELSDKKPGLKPFDAALKESNLFPLTSVGITVFQVNMGYLCNQACRHCHVDASPVSKQIMSGETVDKCLHILSCGRYPAVDITGGAAEMNPDYRRFVEGIRALGLHVKTRTNLTILLEEGYRDLPSFFAKNNVEVIASLPYYLKDMVDGQRGDGTFEASIEALRLLNVQGYGQQGSRLALNLVYNPCGAFLPPSQKAIEADFRRELKKRYGVAFNSVFTITNMPVGRFLGFLKQSGNLGRYMDRLLSSYNPAAAGSVMCRNTISVGYDGSLYDCDFNQMLGLKCLGASDHLDNFDPEALAFRRVATGPHCYGCTAGAGSSCTGAVA